MKRLAVILGLLVLAGLLGACSPSAPKEGDIQTAIAQTAEAHPTGTTMPTSTEIPTLAPSETPYPTATIEPTNTALPTQTNEPTETSTPIPTNTPEIEVIIPDLPEGWKEYELFDSEVVIGIPDRAEIFSEDRGTVVFQRGNSSWIVGDFGDSYNAFGYRVGDLLRDAELQEELLKSIILDSFSDLDSIVFLENAVRIPVELIGTDDIKLVGVAATRRDYVYQDESFVLVFLFPAGSNMVIVSHENFRPSSGFEEDANTTVDIVSYGFNRNFSRDMYWEITSDG